MKSTATRSVDSRELAEGRSGRALHARERSDARARLARGVTVRAAHHAIELGELIHIPSKNEDSPRELLEISRERDRPRCRPTARQAPEDPPVGAARRTTSFDATCEPRDAGQCPSKRG